MQSWRTSMSPSPTQRTTAHLQTAPPMATRQTRESAAGCPGATTPPRGWPREDVSAWVSLRGCRRPLAWRGARNDTRTSCLTRCATSAWTATSCWPHTASPKLTRPCCSSQRMRRPSLSGPLPARRAMRTSSAHWPRDTLPMVGCRWVPTAPPASTTASCTSSANPKRGAVRCTPTPAPRTSCASCLKSSRVCSTCLPRMPGASRPCTWPS
mmetsp:Transcript_26184/g.65100  ORF Transcript_26184/g.65100 Transcript_26184/m.65100 type:complete len:211 (+) Transcript_26184:414-1046(+)